MKLIDAIFNVERPETASTWENAAPVEEISQELCAFPLYSYPAELGGRLKAYPIFEWLCTDEMVGLYAIYLDGLPRGAYYRECRKCPHHFVWLNQKSANRVREVIEQYRDSPAIPLIDRNEELFSNGWTYRGDGMAHVRVKA